MTSRALTKPAPWRFSDFRMMPRGCAARKAAAARIRGLRRCRPLTPGELKRRREQGEADAERAQAAGLPHRRRSIWNKRYAVGCVETGELFGSPLKAAEALAVQGYFVSNRTIQRSCVDGRWVTPLRLRFVWLNRQRWPVDAKRRRMRIGKGELAAVA